MCAGERRTGVRRVTSGSDRVLIDVRQAAGARTASGTFRFTQESAGVALEMKEFGQLQTMAGWASFSGLARLRSSEPERAVTVILDGDELIVSAGDFSFTTAARRP